MLVAKCSQSQDADQWQSLVERLQPVFARTIYRLAASTSGGAQLNEVDDLVQDSFLKLKGRMDGFIRPTAFENEAAAVAYFKVLAANTAKDYFRSRSAGKRSDSATTSLDDRLEELISGESASLDRQVLFTQIDRASYCQRNCGNSIAPAESKGSREPDSPFDTCGEGENKSAKARRGSGRKGVLLSGRHDKERRATGLSGRRPLAGDCRWNGKARGGGSCAGPCFRL